ncbi:MAG: hypothetical protein IJM36_02310 [Acholeplasmatales bacterium]|nr:hypothetical protein [Acholeplasmatales bacterium]
MFLNINPYLIIAIALIALIAIIFIVSFIINRRTPLPKGCENIKIEEQTCLACSNTDCKIHQEFDLKQIEKELKEESKDK